MGPWVALSPWNTKPEGEVSLRLKGPIPRLPENFMMQFLLYFKRNLIYYLFLIIKLD